MKGRTINSKYSVTKNTSSQHYPIESDANIELISLQMFTSHFNSKWQLRPMRVHSTIAENGQNLLKMAKNWQKLSRNYQKWPQIDRHFQKWQTMVKICSGCHVGSSNGQYDLMNTKSKNSQKLTKMSTFDKHGLKCPFWVPTWSKWYGGLT